ncbi:MAG: lysyl oxidase family protein [Solirubrobacteraceae bacterium]
MLERARRPIAWLIILACAGLALTVSLHEARASSQTPQLPDLVADPPNNISLDESEETPTGGHMEAELLLRFNGYVHNKGPGALDFRGMREAPPNPSEPALPLMGVFQRIYEYPSTEGPPPTEESTPHKDEPSRGVMEYVTADGHEHWHLQHVAYYSLWNAGKTAEVAPSQKVGFCLEDSEHVEPEKGPSEPVYKDGGNHPREFCRYRQPATTEVFEGISEGWRDLYTSDLAFQWVNVSNVLPGEYWLRAEVDPEHFIQEAPGPKPPAYAEHPTIVAGFDAQAQSRSVAVEHPLTVTLTSRKWEGNEPDEQPSAVPSYAIVTPPAHGTLSVVTANHVEYTPTSGYEGTDSFTFSASDPYSPFPKDPAIATVSIDVSNDPASPSVAIEGAPASVIAGTSVQLSALVSDDTPEVTWSASAGSVAPTGPSTSLYTAPSVPPVGKLVTIAAESPGGGHDQRTIEILPITPPQPNPEVPVQPPSTTSTIAPPTPLPLPSTPSTEGTPSTGKSHISAVPGPLSSPGAMLIGRKLYMTATAREAGRLRLTALLRGRRIGSCMARVRSHQSFTCTTTLPKGVSVHASISVWATLRVGSHLLQTVRRAARVPTAMSAMDASAWLDVKQAWRYICGV